MDRYQKEIIPQLQQRLGRQNVLSLPKLQKIVLNMGVGKALQDKNRIEQAAEHLSQIAGQRAQVTLARQAIMAAPSLIGPPRQTELRPRLTPPSGKIPTTRPRRSLSRAVRIALTGTPWRITLNASSAYSPQASTRYW